MSFVYLIKIKNTDIYKIGITRKHPKANVRKKGLQTGNPFELEYHNYYETDIPNKIEKCLHRLFAHKKYMQDDFIALKGEWFRMEINDVLEFLQLCKKIENGIKITNKETF